MTQADTIEQQASKANANTKWRIRFYQDGDVQGIVALSKATADLERRDLHLTEEGLSMRFNLPETHPLAPGMRGRRRHRGSGSLARRLAA